MWHIWTLDDWEKNIDLERSYMIFGQITQFFGKKWPSVWTEVTV